MLTDAPDEPVWLTYADAARRVRKDVHTVKRWRRDGMPMEWREDDLGHGYRVVAEHVLLAWWRDRMQASPVHFNRMRRKAIERGETPPPIPDRFRYTRKPVDADSDASERSPLSRHPGSAGVTSDPLTALLRDLSGFPGQVEHAALVRAMEDETPGCDGLEVFTMPMHDPEHVKIMRAICSRCPVIDLCRAYAIAGRPPIGMWAAMMPAEIQRAATAARAA